MNLQKRGIACERCLMNYEADEEVLHGRPIRPVAFVSHKEFILEWLGLGRNPTRPGYLVIPEG